MNEIKQWHLKMPNSGADVTTNFVKSSGVVVIVGANGSGKSRLGSWIEMNSGFNDMTHRISAQKSLQFPETVSSTSIDFAHRDLIYGSPNVTYGNKFAYRWNEKPLVHLLNDYQKLLTYLFSEESEINAKYRRDAQLSNDRVAPPRTKLDQVRHIWEHVLPRRKLLICGGKVEVEHKNSCKTYNASEMSDGERVIFYLIGECLAAPANGVIIIDEPELHLHKSIQATLWNKIEASRPDCLFIYLTHDIDFAASRCEATKIWVKEYNDGQWEWQQIIDTEGVPEQLLLSLIGSRKPVIFVEGDSNSLDFLVYTLIYNQFSVIPCKNAEGVIHSTRSFSALKHLHHIECKGIIDRDRRTDGKLAALKAINVFSPDVNEVENLFLIDEVLRLLCNELLISDIDTKVEDIRNLILARLTSDKEIVASNIAAFEIEDRFKSFNNKARGEIQLTASVEELFHSINPTSAYRAACEKIDAILNDRNYAMAIKIYNNKGLLSLVGQQLGYSKDFVGYLRRLIASDRGLPYLVAISKVTPSLDHHCPDFS